MHKSVKNFSLQFDILREGRVYIAYCPALDLATHGSNVEDARKSFLEAAELFFETIIENDTLEETLTNLGWQVKKDKLAPPLIISRNTQAISLPRYL